MYNMCSTLNFCLKECTVLCNAHSLQSETKSGCDMSMVFKTTLEETECEAQERKILCGTASRLSYILRQKPNNHNEKVNLIT